MTKYLNLSMKIRHEEDQWVGECEELGTMACGDSPEEAKEALEEAILLNVQGLVEAGELNRFLMEHNIPLHSQKPVGNIERVNRSGMTKLVPVAC